MSIAFLALAQRVLGTLALGHVPEHDLASRLAVEGHRAHQDLDVEGFPVQPNEALPGQWRIGLARVGASHTLDHHRAIVRVNEVQDLPPEQRIKGRGAQRTHGLRIGEDHLAVDVHGHGHGKRVHELPVALFALTQRCLADPAHQDVRRSGRDVLQESGFTARDRRSAEERQHTDRLSIHRDQPKAREGRQAERAGPGVVVHARIVRDVVADELLDLAGSHAADLVGTEWHAPMAAVELRVAPRARH